MAYWRRISIARSFAGKFFLDSFVPMSADVCCGAEFG